MFTLHYGCEQIHAVPKVCVPRVNDCNVLLMSLQLIIKVQLKVRIKPGSFIFSLICIIYDRRKTFSESTTIFLKITFLEA